MTHAHPDFAEPEAEPTTGDRYPRCPARLVHAQDAAWSRLDRVDPGAARPRLAGDQLRPQQEIPPDQPVLHGGQIGDAAP